MSDTQKRAIRTLLQASLAGVILTLGEQFFWDWTTEQTAAATAFLTVLITFGQNWFENNVFDAALLYGPIVRTAAAERGKTVEPES